MKYELPYDLQEIDSYILPFLPEEKGLQRTVYLAMNEAVRNGGKRIRPALMLESCRAFSEEMVKSEALHSFMAAIEMIHTFSLIHDDLPCMDNDKLRRGKPTTWYRYGEDIGVLAGDALSLYAFKTACTGAEKLADPATGYKALYILAERSGTEGMLGGQAVDVEKTGKSLSKDELEFIYRLKTGALIDASMSIGALIGGAGEEELRNMHDLALLVGTAFQIEDDILDEISTAGELGKPIHSDEKNKKTTYVSLYGMDRAKTDANNALAEAAELISKLGGNTKRLSGLITWLGKRKN